MYLLRIIFVFVCSALTLRGADTPRRLAFTRGATLYVANLDGSQAKKVATGAWPNLSPDGTRLAFNTETEKTTERHIAIADVATGKVTVLKGVPSDNNFGPVWSPDGTKLIFSSMQNKDWRLAIIDADGTHCHTFTPKTAVGSAMLNSVAWMPDGQSFYAQDMNSLYHFALDGTLLDKHELAKLFPHASFSSGQQFSMSRDGRTLIMDTEMDETVTRKDWDDAPPGIWTLDLSSMKAARLTPKGFFGWMPVWVSDNEFICVVMPEKTRQSSIYRLSIDGKKRELVVKNANSPSVSR